MATKTTIATNLLGRIIKPDPGYPFAWWCQKDSGGRLEVHPPVFLASVAKVVAVFTETETSGDRKGEVSVKVAAEALDGDVEGSVREFYIKHVKMVAESLAPGGK